MNMGLLEIDRAGIARVVDDDIPGPKVVVAYSKTMQPQQKGENLDSSIAKL